MSAAADSFPPKWVMLEPFISCRDDDESFPDESKPPIRSYGTTSWKAPINVTFKLADPPEISRLYAHLPEFPGDPRRELLSIVATHKDLVLLSVSKHSVYTVQDLFIFNASDPYSLQRLPHCNLGPLYVYTRIEGRLCRPRTTTLTPDEQHVLCDTSTGLLRLDEGFVVAEAKLFVSDPYDSKVYADIFWLRSTDCKWNCVRKRIVSSVGIHDFLPWKTHTVIPVDHWLCWIDYYCGILFVDMSKPTPTVTFVPLPPEDKFPSTNQISGFPSTDQIRENCWLYRSVTAINHDSRLKFVKVDRDDCLSDGPLKRGAGFTITCHTLTLFGNILDIVWEKDYTITSEQLWAANPSLRRDILMFPQVSIDRPHVVHFLIVGESKYLKKNDMWVVTIDMETMIMESYYQYINGEEVHGTEDADLAEDKSEDPQPFLPCEFSKFLHL